MLPLPCEKQFFRLILVVPVIFYLICDAKTMNFYDSFSWS